MEIPIEKLTQEQWEVFEALNAQKDDYEELGDDFIFEDIANQNDNT